MSLPHRLRYLLAWDHDLCRTVVRVYVGAVLGFLRTRARHAGLADGRSGAVAIIQRFGGALNLNVHIHALVIDGVFTDDGAGLHFHPACRLTRDDVAEVVAPITVGPCHAHVGGFDLHAGIVVRAGERERLERLCRYTLRPPIAQKRLHVDADGYVWIAVRHPWADGTTHLRFEPAPRKGIFRKLALVTRP